MLSFDQIKELIELVAHHRLQELQLERSGFKLTISGKDTGVRAAAVAGEPAGPASSAPGQPSEAPAAAGAPAPAVAAEPAPAAAGANVVRSPIVGTFYAAPSPDAEPFVRVGDRVRKGQVLCIVEAMKLMNEIEAEVAGTVLEVLVDNGKPVEFGDRLFKVKTV